MKKFLSGLFFVLFLMCTVLCGAEPKYVFLFIGDGMGKPHVDLARHLFGKLNMDKLPVKGSVCTINAIQKTTDSAAAGTALACGSKTLNGRLGLDANGKEIYSSAVLAKQQGRRAAVLTTVGVNNATPAAFYAHVMKRSESQKIMDQFPASNIDLLCGSGIDGMKNNVKQEDFLTGKAYQQGGAQGNADTLGKQGITIIAKDDKPFFALEKITNPVLVYSPGVDDIASYVKKSIDLLQDSPKGFFMMVEGGHIDHGAHGNNGQYMLSELKKFDLAIGVALDFYAKHPAETLIVVTADHHTGGLSFTGSVRKDYADLNIKFSRKDSAGALVKRLAAKGITCDADDKAELDKIIAKPKHQKIDVAKVIRKIADKHTGISWKTTSHTSDDVYLFAIGNGSENFAGQQQNSDVGTKLKAIFAK